MAKPDAAEVLLTVGNNLFDLVAMIEGAAAMASKIDFANTQHEIGDQRHMLWRLLRTTAAVARAQAAAAAEGVAWEPVYPPDAVDGEADHG